MFNKYYLISIFKALTMPLKRQKVGYKIRSSAVSAIHSYDQIPIEQK